MKNASVGSWPALALLALALMVLVASPARPQCQASEWFELANTTAGCPLLDEETFSIALDAKSMDIVAVERLRQSSHRIRLRVRLLGEDLATVDLEPADVLIQSHNVTMEIPASRLDGLGIESLAIIFPPGVFACGGTLQEHAVSVPVPIEGDRVEAAPLRCFEAATNAGSRPADWSLSLAPAQHDEAGKAGAFVDFALDKTWGRAFRVHPGRQAWSSHVWKLSLEGSGATHDSSFHDSLKGELAVAWSKSYLGAAAGGRLFTTFWAGAFVRPEATFNGDDRDIVYGARFEGLLNLRKLFGSDLARGRRPYLALAYERVSPDRIAADRGGRPRLLESHDRLQGRFHWKFYPTDTLIVEADWEAHYILDTTVGRVAELDPMRDRLDLTVAITLGPGDQFLPFLRFTRGEDAPTFEYAEEILFGLIWDRLFRGERPNHGEQAEAARYNYPDPTTPEWVSRYKLEQSP